MRIFTKSLLTFVLLCVAGVVNAADIKDRFTSVDQLKDQVFVIYNEVEGKVVYNKDAQNLAVDTYDEAANGTTYYWKLVSLADNEDEAVQDCYLLEAVKANGASIGLWGNNAIYLNSGAEGGYDGCFILGLSDKLGQDCQYGAVWEVEKTAEGFALKNKARGGYFAGVNPAPTGTDPIYWTFCTFKEPEFEVDKKFNTVAELKDQLFTLCDPDGNVIYNSGAQNVAAAPYNTAISGTAYLWKLISLADNEDEAVKDCYLLEAVKEDGSSIGLWGNPAIYLNSGAPEGFNGLFVLGLNGQLGQDCKYGAVWQVEKTANGFALKNKGVDGYFVGLNQRPDAAEPVDWTFCTFKQKEEQAGGVDPTISDDDPAIVANKAALLTALNKAKALDLTLYLPAGAQKLAEAIEAGEALLKAKGGVVAELENARRAILQAIDELVAKAAKAEVAEKEVPEGWENMITNGNFATDDVASFFMVEPGKGLVPAAIEDGVDQGNWHAAVVRSQDNPSQDWDTQFFIRANTPLPVGTKIHVEFDYRSDVDGSADTQSHSEPTNYIHWACVGSPNFTSKWQHYEKDVTVDNNMSDNFQTIAFNLAKNKKATTFYFDNIVFWAQKPAPAPEDEFQDVIKNGNMEGKEVVNFISKSYPSTDMVPSTIVAGAGKDGSKGIVIESPAKVSQDWDSQFWIVLPYTVPAGTTIKLQFDYKASAASSVSTQAHEAPGNYIHWACCGNVDFTTEWQTFDKQFTVPAECDGTLADGGYNKNFKSIAFNLTQASDITYYIDNVKLFLNKDVIATGVEAVKPAVISNEAIFDLQGRRVAQPAKGLYIKNGKKVLIK